MVPNIVYALFVIGTPIPEIPLEWSIGSSPLRILVGVGFAVCAFLLWSLTDVHAWRSRARDKQRTATAFRVIQIPTARSRRAVLRHAEKSASMLGLRRVA
jgi:hypothetical protein